MPNPNPSRDQIAAFVSRVERLEEEIAALNADKTEVYAEARAFGLDVPALKEVIGKRRKQAKNPAAYDERAALIELYESALGTIHATRARTVADHEARA